jgi:hypothetical protein
MNCEQNIERYLQLEDYAQCTAFFQGAHAVVPGLRREMQAIRKIMLERQQSQAFDAPDLSEQIMRRIRSITSIIITKSPPGSLYTGHSDFFEYLPVFVQRCPSCHETRFSELYESTFEYCHGFLVSIYSMLFILLNLEKLKTVLHLH